MIPRCGISTVASTWWERISASSPYKKITMKNHQDMEGKEREENE